MEYILFILSLILAPIIYLSILKKKNFKEIKEELLPYNKSIKKELIGSITLFGVLFIGFILIASIISFTEFGTGLKLNDMEKVGAIVTNSFSANAIYFIILIFIVLFVEEIFFRAFLIPRIGPMLSTIIFTFFHLGYDSISQTIGVFFLGLILAYWFKKNKSIIQNYFGHLLYDLLAIALYILVI
jgi:membrane protease YdiL (CAAX protease family)